VIDKTDAIPGAVVRIVCVIPAANSYYLKRDFVGAVCVISKVTDDSDILLAAQDGYGPHTGVCNYSWYLGELELVRHASPPGASSCDHDFITSYLTGKLWCRKCGERKEE